MRLGLVFNPFSYKLHEENLKIVQRFFGLFPPLSLAWVASIAEKAGHEVIIIDARTLRLSREDVLDRLCEFAPDIIGFMMTTYMFRETLDWIRYLKNNLKVPVVIGGYNLRVYPRESVAPPEIDFGVVEHAYYTIPKLFEELGGGRRFGDVPGLVYKQNGATIVTPHEMQIDFDKFPSPARHLLPNELYAEFPTERRNFTVMVTSLGCPRRCVFCEAGGTRYAPRTPATVVAEMEECYRNHGVREIDIFDYEFPCLRGRTLEICRLLKDKKLDLEWACRARVDSVDEELLREMRAAGCSRIYYGLESGVQEILDRVNKGTTLAHIEDTMRMTRDVGIRPLGFFLIGAPGETRETVRQTVKFAKRLNLDYVQFSKTLAKPLTPLWKKLVADTGYDYWREYILGNAPEQVLPRPWTALSNEEIDRLARRAYLSFHTRPMFLLRSTLKVRSWSEFRRKFMALFEMFLKQEHVSTTDETFVAYDDNAIALPH
ncbi:MAG: radical SAM protein [Candidatus Aureabacteria bacterium]|nr:radical SAM protein [Candidatus Auribacterota bacterium]